MEVFPLQHTFALFNCTAPNRLQQRSTWITSGIFTDQKECYPEQYSVSEPLQFGACEDESLTNTAANKDGSFHASLGRNESLRFDRTLKTPTAPSRTPVFLRLLKLMFPQVFKRGEIKSNEACCSTWEAVLELLCSLYVIDVEFCHKTRAF